MNIRIKILLSTMIVSLTVPNLQVFGNEINRFKLDLINKSCYLAYTTANVNIRNEPNTKSKILNIIPFNSEISISDFDDEWAKIYFLGENKTIAYINKAYLSNDICKYKDYKISSEGFKSFMQYTSIKDKSSLQYKLQNEFAYTGNYGIRQVNSRYCIAIGTAFSANVGTYVDLFLENGIMIPCIVADIKSDKDTSDDNITTIQNGCVSEFVVELDLLNNHAKRDGDISSCCEEWNSPVNMIRVYDKNIIK